MKNFWIMISNVGICSFLIMCPITVVTWASEPSNEAMTVQGQDMKQPDLHIVEQLRDCLSKSDMASRNTCEELLKAITNFDECISAGFSVMESPPPRCTTPDGRMFVQQRALSHDNIHFTYRNTPEDKDIEAIINKSFHKINKQFQLHFTDDIQVIVYPDQKTFWTHVFKENENNHRTTGFANHVENIIHLTSPTDTSIKSREDMLRVPIHELVHILLPHSWIDIREGIAVYLADQIRAFTEDDIPRNLRSIITYKGTPDEIRQSYSFAGLKVKFMIEECVNNDYQKILHLIKHPHQELEYSLLGFQDEGDFLQAFRQYLQEY